MIHGRHDGKIIGPTAASDPKRRAGCAIQIVPLPDVARLIKRAVIASAAAKRPYVSCAADGIIVVGLIGTAADRGARDNVALGGERIVATDTRATAVGRVVRSLVPFVFKRHPVRRSQARIRVGCVGGHGIACDGPIQVVRTVFSGRAGLSSTGLAVAHPVRKPRTVKPTHIRDRPVARAVQNGVGVRAGCARAADLGNIGVRAHACVVETVGIAPAYGI